MSILQIFAVLSYFFVANHIHGHWDHLPIMYLWHHVFLRSKAQEMICNWNWEQVYRVFVRFTNLKTYSFGFQVHAQAEHMLNASWTLVSAHEHKLVSGNSPWTPIECAWKPMSEYQTAPEHPLNAHECQRVSIEHPLNTHWVRMKVIEWVWKLVSVHECVWVVIEHDSPCCDHEKVLIFVRTEHSLNDCECAWTPLSQ
jgi:hypothetical protein